MTDATHDEGVPGEIAAPDEEPKNERPIDPRMAAMDRIAEQRVQALEEESGLQIAEPRADAPAPDPQPDQIAAQLADDDSVIDESIYKRNVRLKVDGVEQLVPLEQLVRDAQKNRAADNRLAEATRLLREAQAAPLASDKTADIKAQPAQDPSDFGETVKSRVKEALDDVFSGNEGEAAEKLAAAMLAVSERGSAQQPAIDPHEVAKAVKSELERESALDGFAAKYPRIVKDPDLPEIADRTLARLMEEGNDFPTALEKTGQELYGRFGWLTETQANAQAQTPTTNRTQTLATRKAAMDVPSGRNVSAAQNQPAPESSEQQRSRTIAEIAASRRPRNPALEKAMSGA